MKKIIILIMLAIAGATFCILKDSSHPEHAVMTVKAEPAVSVPEVSPFEQAVEIIKKYEGLHSSRHWPLVGYGHKVLPGEKFSRNRTLSEVEAEALLRKDLLKNCAVFREFGADSLLLGVLAYNIGSGATLRSSVVKKLRTGNRDIEANYIAHCKYRGKEHSQIKQRRTEEFAKLFIKDTEMQTQKMPEVNFALSEPAVSHTDFPGLNNTQNL